MTPEELHQSVVVPGLDLLATLGGPPRSDLAEILLVAISGQEANWTAQAQRGGPAHGLWQFERAGGVAEVLHAKATRDLAETLCRRLGVDPSERAVHSALAQIGQMDALDCGFARLLLWKDPKPLPDNQTAAWGYYQRNWRPGKPHPDRWPRNYLAAVAAVRGSA